MKTASALIRLDEICSQNYEWEQENFCGELALLMWNCHGLKKLSYPLKREKEKTQTTSKMWQRNHSTKYVRRKYYCNNSHVNWLFLHHYYILLKKDIYNTKMISSNNFNLWCALFKINNHTKGIKSGNLQKF